MPVIPATVRADLLSGFDDPAISPCQWSELLRQGDTDVVFMTQPWQRAWWNTYGRGKLLLIAARCGGQLVALAPLFADGGMIFFIGSGGSDYLDFIGDISTPEVLDGILNTAREQVADFVGFRFYLVPDTSRTGAFLAQAGCRLGFEVFDEGHLTAPVLEMRKANAYAEAINKQSLRRRERYFERTGGFIEHKGQTSADILPHLDGFFEQHIGRWDKTPFPSLFLNDSNKAFYRELTRLASNTGWLRFTRLDWQNRPIAFHFGFCYNGDYLWYKPTFAVNLATRSPGELLLRRLLIAAAQEEALVFDFGIGDEAFKRRFTTHLKTVRTWGLYPRAAKS